VNPPSVLLDHSFLIAVANRDDDHHDEAVDRYRRLIDDFVEQRCLLVARADHLAAVDNRDLFAPIDKLHVARQHRNAAAEVVARSGGAEGIGIDEAITLVLMHRGRIRQVASFAPRFTDYDADLKVAIPSNFVAANTVNATRATTFAPEAG
jgi:predicted nucleic acid-binding protein